MTRSLRKRSADQSVITSLYLFTTLMLVFIISCGGGGSTGNTNDKVSLSGIAATGAPIKSTNITIRDSKGNTTTATTEADGTYTADVEDNSPFILRIPHPKVSGKYIYSYAAKRGTTANIHPLTDPIMRSWFKVQGQDIDAAFSSYGTSSSIPIPTESEINIIKSVVKEVVKDLLNAVKDDLGTTVDDFDPFTTSFTANSVGFDNVLDSTTVNMSGGVISIAVTPDSSLEFAVRSRGGNIAVSIDTTNISTTADTTPPIAPTNLSAIAVSSSQMLLTWASSSSADVIGYKVYTNGIETATVTSTAYIVSGLIAGTFYTFTIKAFDSSKNLSDISKATATTSSVTDTTVPSAPVGLSATAISSSQINLSWTASTDVGGVAGYTVYRNNAAIVKVFTTNFSDIGLAANTSYTYTVKAFDGAGNISSVSISASATTLPSNTTAPSNPSVLINNGDASTASASVILTLSSTDDIGVTGYCAKESSAIPAISNTCWTPVTSTTSYSANVSFTLSNGDGTKTVYVWFRDASGNVSATASDSITLSDTTNFIGKVTTAIGSGNDRAYALGIQSDGKIVVAGESWNGSNYDFAVARYNTDGTLDTTFGTSGKVTTAIGSGHDFASALGIQSDGKIVVAGSTFGSISYFALVRYNTDGILDTTFGTGGKVTASITSSSDYARALKIQSDGKIVVLGETNNGTNFGFTLARFNTNGTLDSGFGTNGKVTTFSSESYERPAYNSLGIQSDGKIVIAGEIYIGGNTDYKIMRYNTNGTLDTTFGTSGIVTTAIGSGNDSAYSLVIQSDGKILIGGTTRIDSNFGFGIVRYNTDGSLDTTFDSDGKVITAIGSTSDSAYTLGIQSDGKIVAAGYSYNGSNLDFALVRYNTDGSLDTTFDSDGKITTPIGSGDDSAYALGIQSDGKIVVAGESWNGSNYDFALARYK